MKDYRHRILILGRSSAASSAKAESLRAGGYEPAICMNMESVCREIERGVGVLLMSQETLTPEALAALEATLKSQPPWSQIPIVVLLERGELAEGHSDWLEILEPLGNVTLVELPVCPKTLLTIMRTAMSLRDRQYQVRNLLQQLEVSNRTRDEFLTNISHEIRTPLCAVLGFSELLMDRTLAQHERAAYIQTIRRNGAALSGLIDDILELNRPESEDIAAGSSEAPLVDVIDDVLVDLEQDATQKGLALIVQRGQEFHDVMCGDAWHLRQILRHVIGNAIKFTSRGSVTMRISGGRAGQSLRFEIEDTGMGISKAQTESLFKPFCQIDGSSTRKYGGSGLGLALARKLARAMGGELELKWSMPGPGGGSCFVLTLGPTPAPSPIGHEQQVECVAN